jgi:hypothetical protein
MRRISKAQIPRVSTPQETEKRESSEHPARKETRDIGEVRTVMEKEQEELIVLKDFSVGEASKGGIGKEEEMPCSPWEGGGECEMFLGFLIMNQF